MTQLRLPTLALPAGLLARLGPLAGADGTTHGAETFPATWHAIVPEATWRAVVSILSDPQP
ncbi:MAG: hypothetical protein JO272_09425 [Pseudonocardiales bacterium]|nr:hypothetical protein [Pseudonocardiales bacterium]